MRNGLPSDRRQAKDKREKEERLASMVQRWRSKNENGQRKGNGEYVAGEGLEGEKKKV